SGAVGACSSAQRISAFGITVSYARLAAPVNMNRVKSPGMDLHVKVLGAVQIAFGVIGLLFALRMVFVFGGAAGIVGASGNADASIAVPIIGLTGLALVGFLALTSLPSVIVGIGLVRLRPWARIAGIVISILSLVMIPF